MKDTFKHKGLRNKLALEVKRKGVLDFKVLKAIESIPRHLFMDSSFIDHAYQDKAFPIAAGQTISQPYTVAFQSELLKVNKGDKILEIGLANMITPVTYLPEEDALTAVVCGSRAPINDPNRAETCILIQAGDQIFIFDTGNGSAQNLNNWNTPWSLSLIHI